MTHQNCPGTKHGLLGRLIIGRNHLKLPGAIVHLRCGHGESMLAPSSNHLSMPGSAAGGAGTAIAGAAFASSTMTGAATGEFVVSGPPPPPPPPRFKCVSFMRHSIATHNEAAATSTDAMSSVYLSEAYADSR